MGIDIEVGYGKSHVDRSLQMTGKGTGISPLLEELIVEMDPLLNLNKIGPPTHLPEKIPFVDFKGFTFFKVGAILDGPDSEWEFRKSAMISFSNREKDFPRPHNLFSQKSLNAMLYACLPQALNLTWYRAGRPFAPYYFGT
jgi:hypothetical protein